MRNPLISKIYKLRLHSHPMEELNRLFKELKDFESISKMYLSSKKEANMLINEIEKLKRERNMIDPGEIENRIKAVENELMSISRELECSELLKNVCLSIDELEHVFRNIPDEKVCFEKAEDFMKTLISSYVLSNYTVFECFNLKLEEDFFHIVKISGEIENFFNIMKNKSFYKVILNEFKSMVKAELNQAVPFDLNLFMSNYGILLIFPLNEEFLQEEDDFKAVDVSKCTFLEVSKNFKVTAECILSIAKDNLAACLIKDNYHIKDVEENNKQFENTDFYIKNVNEWIVDVSMRKLVEFTKKRDFVDTVLIEDKLSGDYVSNEYFLLCRCQGFIFSTDSQRREKAMSIFSKAILRFFSIDNCSILRDYFVTYSDLTHFIKKNKDFVFLSDLDRTREDLFYKILEYSTNIDIDLNQSVLMSKARLKQIQVEFEDLVHDFIGKNTQKFFIIQFFERLYNLWIKHLLAPKIYNGREKADLKSILKYLMEISYAIEPDYITNYKKISNLYEFVDCELEKIKDMFYNDEISLDKFELRSVLRNFHESSAERDHFLDETF